ncbi:hypothetical protein niasHS_002053 [Heterodera schachtii]|uniref:Uncharacterized protein n=1 Tax=Heterodera schachtii TaxID=97005 RepID=A0ABD2K5T8_HETSC
MDANFEERNALAKNCTSTARSAKRMIGGIKDNVLDANGTQWKRIEARRFYTDVKNFLYGPNILPEIAAQFGKPNQDDPAYVNYTTPGRVKVKIWQLILNTCIRMVEHYGRVANMQQLRLDCPVFVPTLYEISREYKVAGELLVPNA